MPEHRIQPYRDFPPVEPIDVPEKFSQTFLRHYEECPRSAYLYAKYRGGAASHPLERGTLFHTFAEQAIKTMIEHGENSMPPEQGKELMEHLVNTEPHVVPYSEIDDLYGMAWNFCEATWIDPATVIAVEAMFELEVAGRILRGRIDLATAEGRVAEVIDYKTKFAPPPGRGALKTFQTALYSTGIRYGSLDGAPILDHLEHFSLREEYPRTIWEEDGKPTLAYRDALVSADQLGAFRIYLEGLVGRVERSFATWDFKAVEGDHCSYCPCRAECPIPVYLRGDSFRPEDEVIESDEQAAAAASRRFFMKKQLASDLKALKVWANEHGEIRYGRDLILENTATETTKLKSKPKLVESIDAAVTYGKPFDLEDHYRTSHGHSLAERALTEHELAAEAGVDTTLDEEEPSQ